MSMVELVVVVVCGVAGFFIVSRFLDARSAIRDDSKADVREERPE